MHQVVGVLFSQQKILLRLDRNWLNLQRFLQTVSMYSSNKNNCQQFHTQIVDHLIN